MAIYRATYFTIQEPFQEFPNLDLAKKFLNELMIANNYADYETAWIFEYSFIGRNTKEFYYSRKDNKWHFDEVEFFHPSAWFNAKFPFTVIMPWVFDITGIKASHDKKIADHTRKQIINEQFR